MPWINETVMNEATTNELDKPIWSVITTGEVKANGITYPEAVKVMEGLPADEESGARIVTDEAAARLRAS